MYQDYQAVHIERCAFVGTDTAGSALPSGTADHIAVLQSNIDGVQVFSSHQGIDGDVLMSWHLGKISGDSAAIYGYVFTYVAASPLATVSPKTATYYCPIPIDAFYHQTAAAGTVISKGSCSVPVLPVPKGQQQYFGFAFYGVGDGLLSGSLRLHLDEVSCFQPRK